MSRQLNALDRLLIGADRSLKTLLSGSASPKRESPANALQSNSTPHPDENAHIAGLMRINHCGEVCAQALYQGQALTARRSDVKQAMQRAADEEIDHLAWCEQRLAELGSHPSLLNPAFYAGAFAIGAAAGAVSDKVSLGFVAATEEQVCQHLREHLECLPEEDAKSRAILEQMLCDEAEHASTALASGGLDFPPPIKKAMTLLSKVMTLTTYRI